MKRLALAGLALPLLLTLGACGESSESNVPTSVVTAVPPPAGQQWIDVAAETPEGGFRIGNPDAPLKLVEYASHTCPHCADFAAESHEGIEEYVSTGAVSFELRNQVHDPLDMTMALLARCGDPATFQPLASQFWANQPQIMQSVQNDPQALQQAMQAPPAQQFQQIAEATGLIDFVAARGVSREQATQCLARTDLAQQIAERSQTQSEELDVQGTPTFFLNGNKLDVGSWEQLDPILRQKGAPSA
ncbi:thioredoxin domain-containing protein [Altericroceibacterium xinjiangense]|uniref:thioredoxin domain-containing protein n=1 Tax=Altericroceibacterium xinjiangense TaxID=762261 RepID=UPI000F7DD39F|nr:thioredoxin domain-containing protein [Altericroceibacterium xinjiangense]